MLPTSNCPIGNVRNNRRKCLKIITSFHYSIDCTLTSKGSDKMAYQPMNYQIFFPERNMLRYSLALPLWGNANEYPQHILYRDLEEPIWRFLMVVSPELYLCSSKSSFSLTHCMLGNFSCFRCRLPTFFKINFFKKILSGTLSECQMLWIQITTDILIWVQTACNGYPQTTKVRS